MLKIKYAAGVLVALLPAFPAGSAAFPGGGPVFKADMTAYNESAVPAEAEPSAEPTQMPELMQTPEPTQTPELMQTPEPAQTQEPTQAPEDDEVLLLPEIPKGTPAPSQIKRLPDSGMVCLTFDDGYGEASIITILDCLRENDVHCTFFVIGVCLKRYPDLWRQAVADGHEIAYHTMTHYSLNKKSNAKIVKDINLWSETARDILGADYEIPKIARAPGGSANARVRRLFYRLGYKLIYWSSDTLTGVYRHSRRSCGKRIAAYIIKKTAVGSISLQHFNKYDASSVSLYIAELKEKFTLGTVSEALAASGG